MSVCDQVLDHLDAGVTCEILIPVYPENGCSVYSADRAIWCEVQGREESCPFGFTVALPDGLHASTAPLAVRTTP